MQRNESQNGLAGAVWISTGLPIMSSAILSLVDRGCSFSVSTVLDSLFENAWPAGMPRLMITAQREAKRLCEHYGPTWVKEASFRTVLLEEADRGIHSSLARRARYRIAITESVQRIEHLIARAWREGNPPGLRRVRNQFGYRSLTIEERRLFGFIASGVALKFAAAQLSISYKTADCRRTNIYRKLNIKRACEATLIAVHEGLIRDFEPAVGEA